MVLAGGMDWDKPEAEKIAGIVEEARRRGLPVGAICNAVSFLAVHGFLNEVRHTGNTVEMLQNGAATATRERPATKNGKPCATAAW